MLTISLENLKQLYLYFDLYADKFLIVFTREIAPRMTQVITSIHAILSMIIENQS